MKTRKEKEKDVEYLIGEFGATRHAFLCGFQGLTVSVDTELRAEMRKNGIRYNVVKNTLAKRAARGTALEVVEKHFVGPTAVAINPTDPVGTAKLLQKFSKDHPKFVFKAGVVEGKEIAASDLAALANMPSKEQLISKIMFLINSGAQRIASATGGTARNLAVVMKQIEEKKSA